MKVVIVGVGFGGLTLAKKLSKLNVEVLLIDKNNYHTFQPLLYQVATGGLEAENIVYPVRKIFRKKHNVYFRMAEVFSIDEENKKINTNIGAITYDILVLSIGSTNNYYNFDNIKDKLLPLKSLSDAFNIRSFIMQNLEKSLLTKDGDDQEKLINIAVIGGGPAGIEIAGALAEMKKYVLPLDFPELDLSRMNICIFEAAPKLLSVMSENSSIHALRYLKKLGVCIRLGSAVKEFDGEKLYIADGTVFNTQTVIWTAGVKPAKIEGLNDNYYLQGGRIKVDEYNKVINSESIYAIGDVAACVDTEFPKGLPQLAPVAIQQAKQLALNIKLQIDNKPFKKFKYKNKGVMATIGRRRAVVDLPNWKFNGLFAWFFWMFIHIMSIIGFRSKVVTFIDWSLSYFNYDKPLGIIIPTLKKTE